MIVAKDCLYIKRGGSSMIVSKASFDGKFKSLGYKIVSTSEEYAEAVNKKDAVAKQKPAKKAD